MKWWDSGDEGVSFTHRGKPALGPFLSRHLAIDGERPASRPVAFEQIDVPDPALPVDLRLAQERAVGAERVSTDALDRVVHVAGSACATSYGHRAGDVGRIPDGSYVRVATPAGMLVTRPVPGTSTGPSVREMVLGSEARLGIITETTVHVRRTPEKSTILGYLFPSWREDLAAMRATVEGEVSPLVTRVSDAHETRFSFSTKQGDSLLDRVKFEGPSPPTPRGGATTTSRPCACRSSATRARTNTSPDSADSWGA